jgi:hypothetical protein
VTTQLTNPVILFGADNKKEGALAVTADEALQSLAGLRVRPVGALAVEFRIHPGVTIGAFEISRGVRRREQKELSAAAGARDVIGTKLLKTISLDCVVASVCHVLFSVGCVSHTCIIPGGSDK